MRACSALTSARGVLTCKRELESVTPLPGWPRPCCIESLTSSSAGAEPSESSGSWVNQRGTASTRTPLPRSAILVEICRNTESPTGTRTSNGCTTQSMRPLEIGDQLVAAQRDATVVERERRWPNPKLPRGTQQKSAVSPPSPAIANELRPHLGDSDVDVFQVNRPEPVVRVGNGRRRHGCLEQRRIGELSDRRQSAHPGLVLQLRLNAMAHAERDAVTTHLRRMQGARAELE
ncbi:MAG: hypothetical protein QM756_12130 [Polyangiaceae bacterium]